MDSPLKMPRRTLIVVALTGLLLLTVAAYARGMNGDFEFDDPHTVQFNRSIRHLGNFFTSSAIVDAIHGKRVLTDFTFALDYRFAGLDPFAFHATNLAIHLAATLLIFFFTRQVLAFSGHVGRDLPALAVTAVFALHPLQTQAVIYISQRAESLASGLYLGSLLLLLRAEKRGRCTAGAALYVSSFALFVLGLSAKLIVATLPIAYLLFGLLPGPHGPLARPKKSAGGEPSREAERSERGGGAGGGPKGMARPSEASGEGWRVGSGRAERTLSGFPSSRGESASFARRAPWR